jgi:two-component system OmpR family response regulator
MCSARYSNIRGMKILLIEDERKITRALKLGFQQERMVVEIMYDGKEGLAAALHDSYDVIILDRMLPGGKDGIEICKELRDNDVQTPLLLLTAKGRVQDKIDGLNAGADDYLVKPFSFEELLARVRALLRRPTHVIDTVLHVDDLSLDPTAFSVSRGGTSIKLSQTEFALLEYLMRNKGRVLSKSNIINHVWDFDADILPNTVEAYIGYLRRKVDRPFSDKPALIHTVHGFGYKVDVSS